MQKTSRALWISFPTYLPYPSKTAQRWVCSLPNVGLKWEFKIMVWGQFCTWSCNGYFVPCQKAPLTLFRLFSLFSLPGGRHRPPPPALSVPGCPNYRTGLWAPHHHHHHWLNSWCCYFVVLVPPLTGGTTTRVSGGTITVQAVAVVIYNYILCWRWWNFDTSIIANNHSHPKQPKQ